MVSTGGPGAPSTLDGTDQASVLVPSGRHWPFSGVLCLRSCSLGSAVLSWWPLDSCLGQLPDSHLHRCKPTCAHGHLGVLGRARPSAVDGLPFPPRSPAPRTSESSPLLPSLPLSRCHSDSQANLKPAFTFP